jgi:hypothetical protein
MVTHGGTEWMGIDGEHFDRLTKRLSRRVTKGLLAGGAAGIGALLETRQSQARTCKSFCH